MEADRACDFILNSKKRSKRSVTEESTGRVEWNIVDSQNRRALERSALAVSAIPNMPSAVPVPLGSDSNFNPRNAQCMTAVKIFRVDTGRPCPSPLRVNL
jgi:hypothetical protein